MRALYEIHNCRGDILRTEYVDVGAGFNEYDGGASFNSQECCPECGDRTERAVFAGYEVAPIPYSVSGRIVAGSLDSLVMALETALHSLRDFDNCDGQLEFIGGKLLVI